ncbi:hypothetical protein SLEP1_g25340 [Rubroshorea leprosula]|uniref:Uncharacterized protein n=1 Tax=Rubroshorea leprosula TaxID=152421 RepID=A0AAV5JUP3_9ROSI|nr:hypothetical protein SLEP1_g25340 [Rubroshorea leprosula]
MWSIHHVEDYVGDGSEEGKDEENKNGPKATLTAKVALEAVVVATVVGRRVVGRPRAGIIEIGLGGSTVGGCNRGSGTIHGGGGGVGSINAGSQNPLSHLRQLKENHGGRDRQAERNQDHHPQRDTGASVHQLGLQHSHDLANHRIVARIDTFLLSPNPSSPQAARSSSRSSSSHESSSEERSCFYQRSVCSSLGCAPLSSPQISSLRSFKAESGIRIK